MRSFERPGLCSFGGGLRLLLVGDAGTELFYEAAVRQLGGRQAPRLGEFDVFPRRRRAARRAVPRLELGFKIVPRELEGPVAGVLCVLILARQRAAT